MSGTQLLFLAAFSLVNVAVLAAAVVIVGAARRFDGGGQWLPVLRRLGRLPADRSEANRLAFYAHRLSGLGIFAFLALHIVDVALYAVSAGRYDEVHELYGSTGMRVFECALLGALLFHALNGLRLVAIDLWDIGARAATRCLTAVVLATAVLTAAGSGVILAPVLT